MKTDIYFYSGTGNSLWTARRLAENLGGASLHPVSHIAADVLHTPGETVGFVFPVHIWGVPRKIIRFIDILAVNTSKYYFAVAVNAGQVAATLLQLENLMKSKGLILSAGYDLVMPSNYIPWGGPGPEEKWRKKIEQAEEKLKLIVSEVAQKKRSPVERGPLWQNVIFSLAYRMSFDKVAHCDENFWVDDKCTSCGICEKVCPALNIEMVEGRPVWRHRCEQCLACIQWCPSEAIQYGKKTPGYTRYHHPEVTLGDIIACAPADT